MEIRLKVAMLRKGVRQTRMAVELGWDPAKLSRIVNQIAIPTAAERTAMAKYLGLDESELFGIEQPAGEVGISGF
jgi:transcriptional regulator with XRE-family HTH domain